MCRLLTIEHQVRLRQTLVNDTKRGATGTAIANWMSTPAAMTGKTRSIDADGLMLPS
jgi:hypothetical protein